MDGRLPDHCHVVSSAETGLDFIQLLHVNTGANKHFYGHHKTIIYLWFDSGVMLRIGSLCSFLLEKLPKLHHLESRGSGDVQTGLDLYSPHEAMFSLFKYCKSVWCSYLRSCNPSCTCRFRSLVNSPRWNHICCSFDISNPLPFDQDKQCFCWRTIYTKQRLTFDDRWINSVNVAQGSPRTYQTLSNCFVMEVMLDECPTNDLVCNSCSPIRSFFLKEWFSSFNKSIFVWRSLMTVRSRVSSSSEVCTWIWTILYLMDVSRRD